MFFTVLLFIKKSVPLFTKEMHPPKNHRHLFPVMTMDYFCKQVLYPLLNWLFKFHLKKEARWQFSIICCYWQPPTLNWEIFSCFPPTAAFPCRPTLDPILETNSQLPNKIVVIDYCGIISALTELLFFWWSHN